MCNIQQSKIKYHSFHLSVQLFEAGGQQNPAETAVNYISHGKSTRIDGQIARLTTVATLEWLTGPSTP